MENGVKWPWSKQSTSQNTSLSQREIDVQLALGTYLPNVWKQSLVLFQESLELDNQVKILRQKYDEFNSKLVDRYLQNAREYGIRELACKAQVMTREKEEIGAQIKVLDNKSNEKMVEGKRVFFLAAIATYGDTIDLVWRSEYCTIKSIDNEVIAQFNYVNVV